MGFFSSSPKPNMGIMIDTGNHLFNRIIDVFLVFALIAAARVVVLEAYHCLNHGFNFCLCEITLYPKLSSLDKSFKPLNKMWKEGAYWGSIVALYVACLHVMGMITILGGWINAMLGGVLAGAVVSAAFDNRRDKIVEDAISGGAIAIAVQFLQYLA
ncbi:hypothetical protein ACHQM5_009821 [Ranunculus cassubicifolius]